MEPTSTKLITRWTGAEPTKVKDELVVEEPLEIRVGQQSLIVVMRTPGHDFELAAGFLYTESLITSGDDIEIIAYCDEDVAETQDAGLSSLQNIINVQLTEELDLDTQSGWQRNFHANASCGLCGKMTIESVRQQVSPLDSGFHINQAVLYQLNGPIKDSTIGF